MSKFHNLKISDIVRETADAVSIAFEVPNILKSEYIYKQGQYLTLKFHINNEELRRSYSICSSPIEENELRVAIKKVKDGRMSTFINDKIKIGDTMEVMIPMGNFYTELNPTNKKKYILFAGGSGITPILSILKTALKLEHNSTVALFYGNNDESSIIFKKQLDTLCQNYPDRLKVYHILYKAPQNYPSDQQGMMTKEKSIVLINNYVNVNKDNEYFICGPGPMMDNVVAALNELKIDKENVHIEYFSAPAVTDDTQKITSPSNKNIVANIIIDGDEHIVTLENNETILDAAIRVGIDAPYACQGGSCCTCRALLEEGNVEMAVNYALSASEVKKGYILTCQSRPTTPSVVVNYDKGL